MSRKSNHLIEKVYAHLSKNGWRKSGFLADPALTGSVQSETYTLFSQTKENLEEQFSSFQW
jgi:hypothetical protein